MLQNSSLIEPYESPVKKSKMKERNEAREEQMKGEILYLSKLVQINQKAIEMRNEYLRKLQINEKQIQSEKESLKLKGKALN